MAENEKRECVISVHAKGRENFLAMLEDVLDGLTFEYGYEATIGEVQGGQHG